MPVQVAPQQLSQRGGISFPRNPLIASALRTLGHMDQIGRGLPTIVESMAQVTSAGVKFAASNADFLAVLPSPLAMHAAEPGGN